MNELDQTLTVLSLAAIDDGVLNTGLCVPQRLCKKPCQFSVLDLGVRGSCYWIRVRDSLDTLKACVLVCVTGGYFMGSGTLT